MRDLSGEVVRDRYHIISELGHGGCGRVYLAKDSSLDKYWALKVIELNGIMDSRLALREKTMMTAIDHPMFPRIVDSWQDADNFCIVSDYIEGISLAEVIRHGPLGLKRAVNIAAKVASAADYLHSLSPPVLFLDIKPENIMIKEDEDIVLIDFGIAQLLDDKGMCAGTKGYAPKEQYGLFGTGHLSPATDVYALAATYYAMRTATSPADDTDLLRTAITNSENLKYREKKFLLSCILSNPDDRIPSMREFSRRLERVGSGLFRSIKYIFAAVLILPFTFLAAGFFDSEPDYTSMMMSEISGRMNNGNYSREALKIIEGYINSGVLDDKTCSYFTFETARVYFEDYADYREALRYFKMLDEEDYPEKEYYIRLCRLQTGFDLDESDMRECLGDFYNQVISESDSQVKFENLLFIASCYEEYCANKDEGIKKAKEILYDLRQKLEKQETVYDFAPNMLSEINRRLTVLNETER